MFWPNWSETLTVFVRENNRSGAERGAGQSRTKDRSNWVEVTQHLGQHISPSGGMMAYSCSKMAILCESVAVTATRQQTGNRQHSVHHPEANTSV